MSVTAVSIHPGLVDPLVRELVPREKARWTPAELRDLTSTVADELGGSLRRVLRYRSDRRWWARLALTDGVELWLLSWLAGQGTGAHDHGGAAGAFTVLVGDLVERYRYPAGPVRVVSRSRGAAVGFGPARVHDVGNEGVAPAASVHAYSPPLLPTRHYPGLLTVGSVDSVRLEARA
ncbi:MAG TPA: cysteine dioxygenase family protein [Pseudonocardiaceae bacterium]